MGAWPGCQPTISCAFCIPMSCVRVVLGSECPNRSPSKTLHKPSLPGLLASLAAAAAESCGLIPTLPGLAAAEQPPFPALERSALAAPAAPLWLGASPSLLAPATHCNGLHCLQSAPVCAQAWRRLLVRRRLRLAGWQPIQTQMPHDCDETRPTHRLVPPSSSHNGS